MMIIIISVNLPLTQAYRPRLICSHLKAITTWYAPRHAFGFIISYNHYIIMIMIMIETVEMCTALPEGMLAYHV